jgi:YVTN family beta-propeller protein
MGEIEDQLERLAAHRAAQVPPYSIATADELVRRRGTRRAPMVVAIAACLAVALVVGGSLLFSASNDPASVHTAAGRPVAGAARGCAGKAYVTSGDGTVSVITTATGVVAARITVGGTPGAVAITPDGRHAYVTNETSGGKDPLVSGAVSVIDTATGVVSATIPVGGSPGKGGSPGAVAITPDGKHAYVTNANWGNSPAPLPGTVSVIDTATGVVSARITVGGPPGAVAITPDGTRAYVANMNIEDDQTGTVSVIDTATGVVSATIPVGQLPLGPPDVAITPDGKHVYVHDGFFGQTVSVITTATGKVSATIPVGIGHGGVAITPDGKDAYVANGNDGTVSVIDTATGVVSATIPVGSASSPLGTAPGGVAITPGGKRAYAISGTRRETDGTVTDGTVSVITTATGKVSATIPVGGAPGAVAICPARLP